VVIEILQFTAGAYLVASLLAGAGLALGHTSLARGAVAVLTGAAGLHAVGFSLLHTLDPTPPLTNLPMALSFTAWIGTLTYLGLLLRFRLAGLVALVAPLAFMSVFVATTQLPHVALAETPAAAGSLPHAHVLLASAGLALLGLAGMAGALFLLEHRRLKRKQSVARDGMWPSLEALDRVNAFTLGVGFPLLTLGVLTGGLWVQSLHGVPWTGSAHEVGSVVYWALYGLLVALRFGVGQGARRCAANAIAGSLFASVAVVSLEILS
jgi:ABC-type transport system involved in cytochrome c biogenesis permease subunit